jgi:hypothetical protein
LVINFLLAFERCGYELDVDKERWRIIRVKLRSICPRTDDFWELPFTSGVRCLPGSWQLKTPDSRTLNLSFSVPKFIVGLQISPESGAIAECGRQFHG